MKILVYRWKAYNYPDVIRAFETNGCEVHTISQTLMNYDVNEEFAQTLRNALSEDSYDFVFTINYFPVISDTCEELGIPYVSYSCDSPLISMYHESVYNDVNRIYLFDAESVGRFRALGVKNIEYLPLGADTHRLTQLLSMHSPFEDRVTTALRRSVSFVGSLYEKNSYDRYSKNMPGFLQGYFAAMMELESRKFGTEHVFDDMMTDEIAEKLMEIFPFEKSSRSFSNLPFVFETTALGFKCAQIQRKRELIALSKQHDVMLFTESDTEDMFSVKNMGGVDYQVVMPWVFRESAVNLNFTIPNIHTGIPLRIWDVLGAGGFLITNHQAELDYYFRDGENLVWFDSEEELLDKADFYMREENDSLRKKIAADGRKLVSSDHRFDQRVGHIIAKM